MTGPRLSRFAIGAALAFTATVTGVTLTGGAAVADGPMVAAVDPSSQTVNYGGYWTVTAHDAGTCGAYSMTVTDPTDGRTITQRTVNNGLVFASYDGAPLTVGSHPLKVQLTGNCFVGEVLGTYTDSTTATVIVKPAPVTLDFRIIADPNQANNATVSVQAHGDFVDQLAPAIYRDANQPLFPAGTWKVEVQDATGKVVFTKSVDQPAGSATYLSDYWTDVPKGQQFTGTASYTVAGSGASTIAVPDSVSASFTSAGATSSSGSAVVIDPKPSAAPTPSGSVAIPAFAVIGGAILGIVALAILIASIVISLRRRRGSPPDDPDNNSERTNEGIVTVGSTK